MVDIPNAYRCDANEPTETCKRGTIPVLYHWAQFCGLVDAGVVHDDDGVWPGEGIHDVEKFVDEVVEIGGFERAVNGVEVENTVEGDSGEH